MAMRAFSCRTVALVVLAFPPVLLLACSPSEDVVQTPISTPEDSVPTPISTPEITIHTPPPSGSMSVEEAIEAARVVAGYMVTTPGLQEIDVDYRPLRPSGIWTIKFKGLFYPPRGPLPVPDVTVEPPEPGCREIEVWVDDGTGNSTGLTVRDAESCS
jgi:hypothetical protein